MEKLCICGDWAKYEGIGEGLNLIFKCKCCGNVEKVRMIGNNV